MGCIMKLVKNISKQKLNEIAKIIGDAFVSNDIFREFGNMDDRKSLVLKYMKAYVQNVYKTNCLYSNDDETAFIGLCFSKQKSLVQQIVLIIKIYIILPRKIRKNFFDQVSQITDKKFLKTLHLEVLMVCVKKDCQGKGKMRELIDFAKTKAEEREAPLVIKTDMEEYKNIYEHYGCRLYSTKKADNGLTRYNLFWQANMKNKDMQ